MKKSLWMVIAYVVGISGLVAAAGLPKDSVKRLVKSLEDSNAEVRLAAAEAFSQFKEEDAVEALEQALIKSEDAKEQDLLVKALILNGEKGTANRMEKALENPQFKWGKGAKPKAVDVVAGIYGKKSIKWLTRLLASEQEPEVRAAAARALGKIAAPPKKD